MSQHKQSMRNLQRTSAVPDLRSNEFLEHAMRTWGNMVLRLALSQLRSNADAEDVFQDTFLRLLKDHTSFNDDEHLKAWLLRVTINRCRDIGRSGAKRRNEPLNDTHASIEAPDLFASDVWEAVGELPFDLRTVVHLFYVEGYKTDEIALIADCPAATVRTRLHRARARLKDVLGAADSATKGPESRPAPPLAPSSITTAATSSDPCPTNQCLSGRRLPMNNDPLEFYALKMREVKASERLLDSVRQEAAAVRNVSQPSEESRTASTSSAKSAHASQRARTVHPRSTKRPAPYKVALAACLAVLALVVGVSLTIPNIKTSVDLDSLTFTVKAYGAVDDTLMPDGTSNMIAFNCETETQRLFPGSDRYENEGFYTGCVFSVEGENIVRVQANVSRGELYRVTSKEYSIESDPELARERNNWKRTKIGEGELLGKYDYVAGVLFYEGIYEDRANIGKDRMDPSRLQKINLYQRLGATIDVPVTSDEGEQLDDYSFGLWTNEPFEVVDYDETDPYPDLNANLDAALDTLDGAQLTITVTFADETSSTQVIDLHAADFKANAITVAANGMNKVQELVPQIVDESGKTAEEKFNEYVEGTNPIHTLYGLVSRSSGEAFPCGEASHPNLTEPLTKPWVIGPHLRQTIQPRRQMPTGFPLPLLSRRMTR